MGRDVGLGLAALVAAMVAAGCSAQPVEDATIRPVAEVEQPLAQRQPADVAADARRGPAMKPAGEAERADPPKTNTGGTAKDQGGSGGCGCGAAGGCGSGGCGCGHAANAKAEAKANAEAERARNARANADNRGGGGCGCAG